MGAAGAGGARCDVGRHRPLPAEFSRLARTSTTWHTFIEKCLSDFSSALPPACSSPPFLEPFAGGSSWESDTRGRLFLAATAAAVDGVVVDVDIEPVSRARAQVSLGAK